MSAQNLKLALKIAAQTTGKEQIKQLVNELENIATSSKGADNEAGKLSKELDSLANQQNLINNFQKSASNLEKQELATVAAAQALEKLQKEAQDTNKPFVQLARSLNVAEKDLVEMRGELTKQTAKHKTLQTQLNKTGVNTKNLSAKKRELAAAFTKTGAKIDTYRGKLNQGSAAEKKHATSLGNVSSKIIALTAAYVGLNQVGSAIKDIFTTGDKFERLGIQMDALMGSIKGGEQATAWVKNFTKNTPLQLADVSKAFVKLKAFGLDPMDGTMQAITDQALKLGGGFQEVEGISLALGQAWAKQKLQGEEILQLVERGIPVWDLLQKATGKNTAELQKLSSAGKLGRDVIKKLIDEMGKNSVGAAAANMALLSGQTSNAKDNMDQFYNLISESGAMDWLKAQLTALNAKFKEMRDDGSLKEWAQAISDTIVATGEAIKKTFTTLYEYKDEIASIAKVWLALKVGNYFSSVVSGARTAIASLAAYRTAIIATETATGSAALAAVKWKRAISFVGKAALYTALISELVHVGFLYKDLLVAENKAAQSKQVLAEQSQKLAFKFEQLSKETKVNITNINQFTKAVDDGVIVWDESLKRYQGAVEVQQRLAQASRDAATAEQQRQQMMTLTLEQALQTTEQLNQQAQSMDQVRGGVQGFINAIDAAKVSLTAAGEQYSQQIVLLDQLREKYVAHDESLKRQAFLAGDLTKAYEFLGIQSGKALDELANKQRGAFELIQQSKEPLELQRLAYLKWADSAIKAANATGKTVPESLKASAAALGLSNELENLINTANKLHPVNDTNSEAFNRFSAAVDATKKSILQNKAVIESSTTSAKDKAEATRLLTIEQERLKAETDDLDKVQQLELMTIAQLRREQETLREQIGRLNEQYKYGNITAQEYNDKKQRMADMLSVVNNLLGDFKKAQDDATTSTKKATKATKDSTRATQENIKQQRVAIQTYHEQANAIQQNIQYKQQLNNLGLDGRGSSPKNIVDFEEKNNVPDYLRNNSREVADYRAQLREQEIRDKVFSETLAKAKNTNASIAELSALYQQMGQRLSLLSAEQRAQVKSTIKATISAIKSAKSSKIKSQNQASTKQNATYQAPVREQNNTSLTNAINRLVDKLDRQQQQNQKTVNSKTVRLELIIGGETFKADLLNEFEQRFLAKLEQAQSVSGAY